MFHIVKHLNSERGSSSAQASPGGRCERCGRRAHAACPRHPSAALLNPQDPAARDWLEGLDDLRRQRAQHAVVLLLVVAGAGLSVAALGHGLLVGPPDPELHWRGPPLDGGWGLLRMFAPTRLGWAAALLLGASALPAASRAEGARRRIAAALPAAIAAIGALLAWQLGGGWAGPMGLGATAAALAAGAALGRRLAGPDPADPWRVLEDEAARERLAAAEPFRLADLDEAERGVALDRGARAAARTPGGRLSGGG